MEIQFYIELASELLLLFIPGYVTVELREKFRLERKAEKFDIALHSILYSFVIGIVYSVIVRIITWPFPAAENGLMQETVKQLIMDNPELAEELKQKIVATFNGKTDEPELAESANEETDN